MKHSGPEALAELDPRWYARLFDYLGSRYDDFPFTRGADQEAGFVASELGLAPPCRVLDVGCGTARHAVELAARGLTVTGVDLSLRLLEIGLAAARRRDVTVNLMHADARELTARDAYDVALSLREGAFGLLEDDAENRRVLVRMRAALHAGGRLALNALHRDYVVARPAEFPGHDPATGWTDYAEEMTFESGKVVAVRYRDRAYGVEELADLVAGAGFRVDAIYGSSAGDFGRHPAAADRMELLLLGTAV